MEAKKTPKANLENKKSTWLLVGYVMVLAFLFISFEWTDRDIRSDTNAGVRNLVFEPDLIPITTQEQPVLPPPPIIQPIEILELVSNEVEIDETDIPTLENSDAPVEIKYTAKLEESVVVEDDVFWSVEVMPEFPGGKAALNRYLSEQTNYPPMAAAEGVYGRVSVQFTVNKDGSIVDVAVAKPIYPALDKEALRVISSMPKWKPGMQNGRPARVRYTIPVMFRLQ
ncbi:MAG: energy transducer TonB [Prevotellaceae bacterium]|jgi:protein TonB|nr:energy transducer TonB [Prevotellaceae bacterium]